MTTSVVTRTVLAGLIVGAAVTIALFVLTAILSSGQDGRYTLGPSSFYFWSTTRHLAPNGSSEVTVRAGLALALTWLAVAWLTAAALWRHRSPSI